MRNYPGIENGLTVRDRNRLILALFVGSALICGFLGYLAGVTQKGAQDARRISEIQNMHDAEHYNR